MVAFLNLLISTTHCSQHHANSRYIDEFQSPDKYNTRRSTSNRNTIKGVQLSYVLNLCLVKIVYNLTKFVRFEKVSKCEVGILSENSLFRVERRL